MPTKQRYCCICRNHAQKWDGNKKITLHRFPSDSRKRRAWISRCRLIRKDFKFTSYDSTRICSDHFVGKMGPTPLDPPPSIFPTKVFKSLVSKLYFTPPTSISAYALLLISCFFFNPSKRIDIFLTSP